MKVYAESHYSPLYKSLVEIVRIRFDCDGETIYHGRINDNDNEILFRASELSEMQPLEDALSLAQI